MSGIPGRIIKIDDVGKKLATADVSGVKRQVDIACIVDAEHPVEDCVGDWVLIHAGFAMSRIDEAEAAETLRILTRAWRRATGAGRNAPLRRRIGRFAAMANGADLRALYPFLHGAAEEAEKLKAALLHSIEEKARKLARDQRSILCRRSRDPCSPPPGRSQTFTGAAAACSRWATAVRVAMPRMSRSNSSIRSPRGARLWRRSTSSPISQ